MYPSSRPYRRFRQLLKLSDHWKRAQCADESFAGEAQHGQALLDRLGVRGGYAVDIAASDGASQSSRLWMFRNQAWSGLAVEMDSEKFAKRSGLLPRGLPRGYASVVASQYGHLFALGQHATLPEVAQNRTLVQTRSFTVSPFYTEIGT